MIQMEIYVCDNMAAKEKVDRYELTVISFIWWRQGYVLRGLVNPPELAAAGRPAAAGAAGSAAGRAGAPGGAADGSAGSPRKVWSNSELRRILRNCLTQS